MNKFNYIHAKLKSIESFDEIRVWISSNIKLLLEREAKYAKNQFQQNRYSVFEGHVMRRESISTKILRAHGNSEVV